MVNKVEFLKVRIRIIVIIHPNIKSSRGVLQRLFHFPNSFISLPSTLFFQNVSREYNETTLDFNVTQLIRW